MLVIADSVKRKKEQTHSVLAENSEVVVDISLTLMLGNIPADRQKRHE